MTGELLTFNSCKPFSDAKAYCFCFQIDISEKKTNFAFKFYQMLSFRALQVFSAQIYNGFLEKPDKLFGTKLNEPTFSITEKDLISWRSERFFVFVVRRLRMR